MSKILTPDEHEKLIEVAKVALKVFFKAHEEEKIKAFDHLYPMWKLDPDSGDGWPEEIFCDATTGDVYIVYFWEAGAAGAQAYVKVDLQGQLTELPVNGEAPEKFVDLSDDIPDIEDIT